MSLPAWLLRKVNDHMQPCIIRCGAQASVFPRTVTYTVPSTLPFPLLVSKLWVPPRGIKKGLPARPCSAWPAQMPPMKVPASSELHGLELPNYALQVFSGKWFLYILDSSLLSDVSFANIFSQSVACLLIPLIPLLFVSKTNFKKKKDKYWVGQRLRCYRKAQTKFLFNPDLCPSLGVSQRSKSSRNKNI